MLPINDCGKECLCQPTRAFSIVILLYSLPFFKLLYSHFNRLIGDLVARKQWSKVVEEKPTV